MWLNTTHYPHALRRAAQSYSNSENNYNHSGNDDTAQEQNQQRLIDEKIRRQREEAQRQRNLYEEWIMIMENKTETRSKIFNHI